METNPADGRGSGERVPCDWCGRPGQMIQYTIIENTGTVLLENPPMCEVCAGLMGVAAGGDDEVKYDAAVREVDLVLIEEYRARRSSDSEPPNPGTSSPGT